MRISSVFDNPGARRLALVATALVGATVVVLSWTTAGAFAGAAAALLLLVILGLAKTATEMAVELRRARVAVGVLENASERAIRRLESVDRQLAHQAENHSAVVAELQVRNRDFLERLDDLTSRADAVHQALAGQTGFNEAAINRVRILEAASRRQMTTNDRLVERIRPVEVSRTRLIEEVTPRLQALETAADQILSDLETLMLQRNHRVSEHLELKLASAVERLRVSLER
jgi:hypothetical protein